MQWLVDLFVADSIAHALLILSVISAAGVALGNVKVSGVGLGVAGVLFSGLFFAHLGVTVNPDVIEFAREFGLVLFVYTIGMQVGPGFLASLRRQGLPLNLMALSVVLLGVLITIFICYAGIEVPVAVGLFSGATTNTPSLAAAQQALKSVKGVSDAVAQMPGLGYAVAYPFGVIGLILVMALTRVLFRIDLKKEVTALEQERVATAKRLETISLEVKNLSLIHI